MTVWDDFVAALHEENGLLEQLIALGTAKQEQINNAPEVRIADESRRCWLASKRWIASGLLYLM